MWRDIPNLYGRAWNVSTVDTGMWDTQTFPTVKGNLCLMQQPSSAVIPLETRLFVGKLNLSYLQTADWFPVTVKCDRWVGNKYYYSPAATRGLAHLFHFLAKGDSLSGDLKDYSSYWFWNIFLCTSSNPSRHYSLRDSKEQAFLHPIRKHSAIQKTPCNICITLTRYVVCRASSVPTLFPLFTDSLLYNN